MNNYTIANTINDTDIIVSDLVLFTFTEFIERNRLYLFLCDELNKIEKSIELNYSRVEELKEYISLLPFDSGEKEECEHRLNNMSRLYKVAEKLEQISLDSVDKDKVNELKALIEVSNHCPLRNLLEKKLNNIKDLFDEEIEQNLSLLDSVKLSETTGELDNIICELLLEDYINLGRIRRKKIAEKLFLRKDEFQTEENFLNILSELVNKISKLDIKDSNETNLDSLKFKVTVDESELKKFTNSVQ